MGGFTSTAPILAGRSRKIPTFVHESNAIPGKANRLTARFVRAVLLGFKECAPFFPRVRTEVTGTPIRSDLLRIDRGVALQKLGLSENLKTALVMGGNIRCGLEDHLYLPSGEMAKSNGELVEVAVRMTRDVGRRPATVEEARKILSLRAAS